MTGRGISKLYCIALASAIYGTSMCGHYDMKAERYGISRLERIENADFIRDMKGKADYSIAVGMAGLFACLGIGAFRKFVLKTGA